MIPEHQISLDLLPVTLPFILSYRFYPPQSSSLYEASLSLPNTPIVAPFSTTFIFLSLKLPLSTPLPLSWSFLHPPLNSYMYVHPSLIHSIPLSRTLSYSLLFFYTFSTSRSLWHTHTKFVVSIVVITLTDIKSSSTIIMEK